MPEPAPLQSNFLSRLLRDRSGNTLALVAAATAPLVAMVGSAVDIGRGYVAQSRLQQACDAGVLGARKKLGSDLPPSNAVLGQIRTVGDDLFDLNFPEGRYDTVDRSFVMTLEEDFAISGTASAVLPTAVMGIFGKNTMPVSVSCQARMNFSNLDIMMVLDTTGSMRHTNPGDSQSRVDSMVSVIKGFHGNLEAAKSPVTRIRYGFVPYAANVNVSEVLQTNWVATQWTYQSRVLYGEGGLAMLKTYSTNWAYVSGTRSEWTLHSTYPAKYKGDLLTLGLTGTYTCEGTEPPYAVTNMDTLISEASEPFAGPPEGTREIDYMRRESNGTRYRTVRDGSTCRIEQQIDTDYVETFEKITEPSNDGTKPWRYAPQTLNVPDWKSLRHCVEELPTYEINDYNNVDLTVALDLNIDHVPTPGTAFTQWKPQNPDVIYSRSLKLNGTGSWTTGDAITVEDFLQNGSLWQSVCPAAPAAKLQEMTADEINSYLSTLVPEGPTYHDIGMMWGARMLSPDGIFAAENVDVSKNKPTARHLIFLTDGQTEPYDVTYGPYGVEPLDRRRWNPDTSSKSLVEVVEARFKFACSEIKKKNTTVWVIAFGTTVNASMTDCAGPGHYFEAANAAQLDEAFSSIARALGDLRVSR